MPRAFAALALAGFLAAGSACGAQSQARPSIRILGARVVGSEVIVKVKIGGWKMAPPRPGSAAKGRTGQWQMFVGNRYAGFSDEPTYGFIIGLPSGTYRIWVALARPDYSLVYPLIRSRETTVRISESAA